MRLKRFFGTVLVSSLAFALATATAAEPVPSDRTIEPVEPVESGESGQSSESGDGALDAGDRLSGEEIYDRVLSNRFNSFDQSLQMTSGDRGGNIEVVEMELKYMDFRSKRKKYLSKSIALYKAPPDVRHLGYLVINQRTGTDDQFVYRPSARRVRRVNLRGESVVGTDFSLEDIIPRELEDARYERLPDEVLDGREVYVVEVHPNESSDSEYSKFVAYVDKQSSVTLRNNYWDRKGVLFKELVSVIDSISQYTGTDKSGARTVWVAKESQITNTRLETYTMLKVTRLVANPKLGSKDFTERRLAQGH